MSILISIVAGALAGRLVARQGLGFGWLVVSWAVYCAAYFGTLAVLS